MLLHAIFEDLEIRRMKAGDVVPFLIRDDDRDEDLLHIHANGGLLGEECNPENEKEDQTWMHPGEHAARRRPQRERRPFVLSYSLKQVG